MTRSKQYEELKRSLYKLVDENGHDWIALVMADYCAQQAQRVESPAAKKAWWARSIRFEEARD